MILMVIKFMLAEIIEKMIGLPFLLQINLIFGFILKIFNGSHVVLKVEDKPISDEILVKCAQIAAKHSKAKLSPNVPVDYCLIQFVKKPSGSKPGMVIFTNNKTLNVNPLIT